MVPAALPADTEPPSDPVQLREPQADETAIELPYRLILSPSTLGGWTHSVTAVEHESHTELWHTRLGVRRHTTNPANDFIDERDDPQRAVRAVWSFDVPLHPTKHVPNLPFRMSLDMRDRYEIVELSANFNLLAPGKILGRFELYKPEAIAVERLMLTSLGGWLHSRGAWDPPKVAYPRGWTPRPRQSCRGTDGQGR